MCFGSPPYIAAATVTRATFNVRHIHCAPHSYITFCRQLNLSISSTKQPLHISRLALHTETSSAPKNTLLDRY